MTARRRRRSRVRFLREIHRTGREKIRIRRVRHQGLLQGRQHARDDGFGGEGDGGGGRSRRRKPRRRLVFVLVLVAFSHARPFRLTVKVFAASLHRYFRSTSLDHHRRRPSRVPRPDATHADGHQSNERTRSIVMPSTASVRRAQKAEREETKKSDARDKAKKDADDAYWAAAGGWEEEQSRAARGGRRRERRRQGGGARRGATTSAARRGGVRGR